MTRFHRVGAALGLTASMLAGEPAVAARFDYLLGVGIEHNDNVNLSEDDPVSENILRPTLGFRLSEDGATVQAYADGALEYRDYLGGHFGNELRTQLSGHVNWAVVPQRLDFVVEDTLGEQPIDTLVANAPANLQQTNVLALGPNLRFRFDPTLRGLAELRYINSYAETTDDFNSQRLAGALHLIKDLSAISQLSANVQAEHIDFTHSDIAPDYDRYLAFGRYARTLRQFDFGVDAGYTWLDGGGRIGSHSKPLLRGSIDWRPSALSTFALSAARQYTDAASSLIGAVQTRVIPNNGAPIPTTIAIGTAAVNADPYLETRVDVSYVWQGAIAAFGIAPYYHRLSYLNPAGDPNRNDLDQSGRGASLFANWRLRPELRLGAFVTAQDLDYRSLDRSDRDLTVGVFLLDQFTRHWSWRIDLSHYRRNSTAAGQSSDQNIAYVSLAYAR
jgi:hypothetical protein